MTHSLETAIQHLQRAQAEIDAYANAPSTPPLDRDALRDLANAIDDDIDTVSESFARQFHFVSSFGQAFQVRDDRAAAGDRVDHIGCFAGHIEIRGSRQTDKFKGIGVIAGRDRHILHDAGGAQG